MNAEVRNENPNTSCQLANRGFEILTDVLTPAQCSLVADELSLRHERRGTLTEKKVGGLRNLLRNSPVVAGLAASRQIKNILECRLNRSVHPVRALFFDKTSDANWSVPWHQDLTIAVATRIETAGFKAWSVKDGILHVQPPEEILEGMVTVRLHLDDCDVVNGALKVIPGSHLQGKLSANQIAELTDSGKPSVCEVSKSGALLMFPLLLHSSSASENPLHRRVLHIEYATDKLPNGLKWFDS